MNSVKMRWMLIMMCLVAVGCGGVAEVPAQTEPGEAASEEEMKKRMEESMKMGGRTPPPANK